MVYNTLLQSPFFLFKIHGCCCFVPDLTGSILCSWQGLYKNGLVAISFDRICVALFNHTLWHLRSNVLLQMLRRPCRTDKDDGGPLGWLSLWNTHTHTTRCHIWLRGEKHSTACLWCFSQWWNDALIFLQFLGQRTQGEERRDTIK